MHIDDLKKQVDAYEILYRTKDAGTSYKMWAGLRALPIHWAEYTMTTNDDEFVVFVKPRWSGDPQPGPMETFQREIMRAKSVIQGIEYAMKGSAS